MPKLCSFAVLMLLACGPRSGHGSTGPDHEAPGYPTRMAFPSALGGDFVVEQEVTMTHPQGENTFRSVLQKRGDEVLLLGLAPHGGRAFLLRQTDGEVHFETYMPFELPFPPEYMLHDIHRTWFLGVPGGGSAERDGERVEDQMQGDRVMTRTFERTDRSPEGRITIRYEGGLAPGAPFTAAPPDRVVFDNGWFGYRATIRTLSWQALPTDPE